MENVNHTFKGDGSFPTPEAGVNWQIGFDHGREYGMKVVKIGNGYDPFPGDSNKGWFGNGFAEGVKSAYSFILFSEYPQLIGTDYDPDTKTTIIKFKNGRFVKIKWNGNRMIRTWSSPFGFLHNKMAQKFNKKIIK